MINIKIILLEREREREIDWLIYWLSLLGHGKTMWPKRIQHTDI